MLLLISLTMTILASTKNIWTKNNTFYGVAQYRPAASSVKWV